MSSASPRAKRSLAGLMLSQLLTLYSTPGECWHRRASRFTANARPKSLTPLILSIRS
jgi:hypothetical protein